MSQKTEKNKFSLVGARGQLVLLTLVFLCNELHNHFIEIPTSEVIFKDWCCWDELFSVGCFFYFLILRKKNLFLLSLVDRPFQPAQKYVVMFEDDGVASVIDLKCRDTSWVDC